MLLVCPGSGKGEVMKATTRILARKAGAPAILLAVFATAFMFAGCTKAANDAAIKSGIEAKYYADPALKSTNLQVVATKGQVMLAGEVPSQELKNRAERLARTTSGVEGVEDRIAVVAPALTQQQPTTMPEPEMAQTKPPRRAQPRRQPERASVQAAPTAAPEPAASGPASSQPVSTVPANEPASAQPEAEPTPEPVPAPVTIPSGTHITVRMIDSVDSSKNKTGQTFRASLAEPIVIDGKTVVAKGADVTIRLAQAKSAGKLTGSSELELQLVKMVTGGKSYPLVSNSSTVKGKSRGKDTATKVGIGAAAGAVIGAIAGGGKGAAIGAGAGAGAGTVVQLATHGQQVKVPSESVLDFVLQQPVSVP
jgi:hypothetical protein